MKMKKHLYFSVCFLPSCTAENNEKSTNSIGMWINSFNGKLCTVISFYSIHWNMTILSTIVSRNVHKCVACMHSKYLKAKWKIKKVRNSDFRFESPNPAPLIRHCTHVDDSNEITYPYKIYKSLPITSKNSYESLE